MFKIRSSIFSLAVMFLISTGISAETGSSYIDISWGVTGHSWDIKNNTEESKSNSDTAIDDEDEGYAVILGASLSDVIAGEISYVNLGETSIKGDGSGSNGIDSFKLMGNKVDFTGSETIKSELSGFGLGVAAQAGSGGLKFSVRSGLFMWDTSGTQAANTTANTFVNSVLFDSGTDAYVGANAKYIMGGFALGIGYDAYGLNGFEDTAGLFSASLGLEF